jgi:hypothetical protein
LVFENEGTKILHVCADKIKFRIAMAKAAFNKKKLKGKAFP